jgi:hypothetical protein
VITERNKYIDDFDQDGMFLSFDLNGRKYTHDEDGEVGCDCECVLEKGSYERTTTGVNNQYFLNTGDAEMVGSVYVAPYAVEVNFT